MKNKKKGFTLVELLVVITIIGIITVLALPGVQQLQARNRNKKFETYADRMEDAGKLYIDSYSNDLFGITGDGCYDISYGDLRSKSLIKNYITDGVVCDDNKSYVHVVRDGGKYKYEIALYCTKDDNVVYNQTASRCNDTVPVLPTIKVTVKDVGGNNNWSKSKNITFKITAQEGLNANTSIRYGWSSVKNQEPTNFKEYNFRNDNGEKELTYTITESGLNGEYYFFVDGDDVIDVRGRFASDVWSDDKLKFDNTNPVTPVLTNSYNGVWANASYVNTNKYVIGVSSNDEHSGVMFYEYRYPNSANKWVKYNNSAGNSFITTPFTAERNELVEIRACDYADNCSEPAKNTIMIDKTLPSAPTVSNPNSNKWVNKNYQITATSKDNLSGLASIQYSTDSKNWSTISGSQASANTSKTSSVTASNAGAYSYYFRACDYAGNCSASNQTVVKIDKDVPSTPTITNTNNNKWFNSNYNISVKSNDKTSGLASIQYSTNNSSWTTISGSQASANIDKSVNLSISSEGSYTYYARACDYAGNCSSSASTSIKLDKTAPSCRISLSGSGSGNAYTSNVTVSISTGDSLSGVASYGLTTSSSASYNGISSATQGSTSGITWYGYVKDAAGNTNSCNSGRFSVSLGSIPKFSYTGRYEIVDDNDNRISNTSNWSGNWKIRLLTSGTLTFGDLNKASDGINVFLVGGGGGGRQGGGGGGYTQTFTTNVSTSQSYYISIGNGGSPRNNGGTTTAFGWSASGGNAGQYGNGAGGAGTGRGGSRSPDGGGSGGSGVREFGSGSKYYGGGGGGGGWGGGSGGNGGGGRGCSAGEGGTSDNCGYCRSGPASGTANTGGGGGGDYYGNCGASGGSGIVIIRNKR